TAAYAISVGPRCGSRVPALRPLRRAHELGSAEHRPLAPVPLRATLNGLRHAGFSVSPAGAPGRVGLGSKQNAWQVRKDSVPFENETLANCDLLRSDPLHEGKIK